MCTSNNYSIVDLQIESSVLCKIRNEECTSRLPELIMKMFDVVDMFGHMPLMCVC